MILPFSFAFLVTDSRGDLLAPSRLESIVDALMDRMLTAESEVVVDSSVGATLTKGEVELEVAILGSDERAASAIARDFIAAAIAAVGGTPVGLFAFPDGRGSGADHEWHERRVELVAS